MSPTGGPNDNAAVERFIKTLKHEEVYRRDYATVQDAIDRHPHFPEEIYSRRRLHSALGYGPPEEYEAVQCADWSVGQFRPTRLSTLRGSRSSRQSGSSRR